MSFNFAGLNSLSFVSQEDDDESNETDNSSHEVSSLVSDVESELSAVTSVIDDNTIYADDYDDDMSDADDNGDEISVMSGLSNASSRKRMDSVIQSNAMTIDFEKLNSYECPCKHECTRNVSVCQIVAARDVAWGGPNQITASVRKLRTFEIVASGHWVTSRSTTSPNELTSELR